MGKGALLRWGENRFLRGSIRGRGMELGALWKRFPVSESAQVWYVDRSSVEDLRTHYPEIVGPILSPDLVADATDLPVAPSSLDFIIVSHLLEHLPFPLKALRSWYYSLRPQGVLLLRVPDKRFTFDVHRTRTPLEHLIEEYKSPESFDKDAHYADWVVHVVGHKSDDPKFDQQMQILLKQDYSIHYHVWTDEDVRQIVEYTQQNWGFDWRMALFWRAHFYRKEAVVLLVREG
jgi:SAM-dependent methyltransferase